MPIDQRRKNKILQNRIAHNLGPSVQAIMRCTNLSEKKRAPALSKSRSLSRTPGCVIIILCQHVLLWSALHVAASAIYALAVDAVMTNNIPSIVMFLVAVCLRKPPEWICSRANSVSQSSLSLFYLVLQNVTTHLRKSARDRWQSERVDTLQSLATFVLRRFLVLTWAVTCILAIVLTASRGILWPCHSENEGDRSDAMPLDIGTTCIVNRAEILASLIAA